MRKGITLAVLALLGIGGYAHYSHWSDQTNKIMAQLEQLSSGENERFRVTYDKVEAAGYPFRHEVALTNPCFYFLQVDPNLGLKVYEGCLKGNLDLSYHPYKADRKVYMESDGELTIVLPPEEKGEPSQFLVTGKLIQEFDFEDNYEYTKSADWVYFFENLLQARILAKDLAIKSIEGQPKEYVEELNGSLDYARKPYDEHTNKIELSADYTALFADSLQNYQPPFDHFFNALNSQFKSFNKKSGLNKGRYQITAVIPDWATMKQTIDRFTRSFSFDDIPDFSIDINQDAKNNYFTNKASVNTFWKREKNNAFQFKFKNKGVQDISKEGVQEFSSLLQDIAQEVVKVMVNSAAEHHESVAKALNSEQFEDLFKGLPQHFEIDLDVDVNKAKVDGNEKLTVHVDPLSIDTDKGGVTLNVDYDADKPFVATVEFGSLVRMIDGFITRYNIIAKVVDQGKRIPVITEKERDQLLAILQKYSDSPDKLPKNVKFTISQGENQEVLIGQHSIYGIAGELGFFFQHLQQKLPPSPKEEKPKP